MLTYVHPFQKSILILLMVLMGCTPPIQPIEPVGPLANPNQLAWQKMEYYAFIHFNMNTFTDTEWGYGDENPKHFNPTDLDTRQWARIIKQAGMKGIVITAKHHDGFALWPSKFSEHTVANSPWKKGAGDVIRELSQACKEYDLKFGIYLSPWDRNHKDYGNPNYISYFRNQLTELLTNYGDVFEVWFDGANGGDGYYGGANEYRKVDKKTYYDWPNTIALVRQLQPKAVIFSDAGPDIRWVGNEKGYANETTWSSIYRDSLYPGMPDFQRFSAGQENGTHWVPTETDVSIRPSWYYHKQEDASVKTLAQLVDIYFNSVGLNSSLLLNIPVDKKGLIHENDHAQLMQLAHFIETTFSTNFLHNQIVSTSSAVNGYPADNVVDGESTTYWTSERKDQKPELTVLLDTAVEANTLMIQEYIPLGQRIKSFSFQILHQGTWVPIRSGTTVGNKRLIRFQTMSVEGVRLTFEQYKKQVLIHSLGLFKSPDLSLLSKN